MTSARYLLWPVLLAPAIGCGRVELDPAGGVGPSSARHTLTFEGGLPTRRPNTVLIAFDLSAPNLLYEVRERPGPLFLVAPNVMVQEERAASCKPSEEAFFKADPLPPGDPAWVRDVVVVMTTDAPIRADGISPERSKVDPDGRIEPNQLCFGVRSASGGWRWDQTHRRATWDAATSRYRVTLPVDAGPIDALRIMFASGTGSRRITEVTINTVPPPL